MAESLQNLKRRLSGVKNINQITRAMELVAATKMRKSQEIALASRSYSYAAFELLANLSGIEHVALPPIFERRAVKKTAFVVVTSDKGLAGAFNSNVIRTFDKWLTAELANSTTEETYIAVGQKAANYLEKKGALRAKFTRVGDFTTVEQVQPLADLLITGFLSGEWDRVVVFSMNFKSALSQEVIRHEIFPIDVAKLRETAEEMIPKTGRYAELRAKGELKILEAGTKKNEYIIEPSPESILGDLGRHLVLMEIYHLILEANASEHAARRTAMKSASDNASDLASALSLEYNKSRQALITREIIEIVAGSEAL
ncbi:MAG TPA: ATP synthase F1 subunit gamma [Candidatus Paceibacterota bacterium]|nr:ATP synthase F1 subunit gamma [Candidatus Paceibacterota bacterium]